MTQEHKLWFKINTRRLLIRLSNYCNPINAIKKSNFTALMKIFGSKCFKGKADKVNKPEKRRCMLQDEIKDFYKAIRPDPILIKRFLTVPIGTVQTLADKILDLLITKEGLNEMIMPFFE